MARRRSTSVDFYTSRRCAGCPDGDIIVLTCDAKGIVMRPDALRAGTAKKAAASSRKLATRLSRAEKLGRKRMAEVVAVYHCTLVPRTPAEVIGAPGADRHDRRGGPKAAGKWLHA
jgi:hypothetical protein